MLNAVKILLIETDPVCIALVSTLLSKLPNTCLDLTGNTNEAIVLMETWEYDIVICDAHLVIGEKLQLVRRMCRTKSSPAVIVATADTNITLDFIRIVTPALCVQDIIYKPIVVSEALVQIERVIEYKRAIAK